MAPEVRKMNDFFKIRCVEHRGAFWNAGWLLFLFTTKMGNNFVFKAGMDAETLRRELIELPNEASAKDLITQLLELDPEHRPSAQRALMHLYFTQH